MRKKYLTKSLFKIGLECPRKQYYREHPELYFDQSLDDPFLKALAEGGFQVGALAKIYYPEGIDLTDFSVEEAVIKTKELLLKEKVIIFEAAFTVDNLLVRVDILKKDSNTVNLYEVKAKSYDANSDSFLDKKTGRKLLSKWEKYLFDVAYQTLVCRKAYPQLIFNPFLSLVNKNSLATIGGLNQKFILANKNGRCKVNVSPGTDLGSVGKKLLIDIEALEVVNLIIQGYVRKTKSANWWDLVTFEDKIIQLADGLINDQKMASRLDSKCRKCEYRCSPSPPLKSGFNECWSDKIDNNKLCGPFVFDVWYLGQAGKSDDFLMNGKILMEELVESDFELDKKDEKGLTRSERQWLQIKFLQEKNNGKYINKKNISHEIRSWKYPLHFIDFETSRVAVPFNSGRKPYEQIAFQFSHHIVREDGTVEHKGQYINDIRGEFPNFEFLRNLKEQLHEDDGTILRYSNHENSVLCDIIKQLENSSELDKVSLIDWIKRITKKDKEWSGDRAMVDLCNMVVKDYYHPLMNGSNSLKNVLKAIMHDSTYLQNKYKLPVYGNEIKSLNFSNWAWVQYDNHGTVLDPYQLLPKLFDDIDLEKLDTLFEEDEIRQGGSAMAAYAKLQFSEMSEVERQLLKSGLLKYCELDTFAMVLLYQYFTSEIS